MSYTPQTHPFRNITASFLGLLMATGLSVQACDDKPTRAPLADDGTGFGATVCEDKDGDSFGFGCRFGSDCDDNDAAITNQCVCADRDAPGCDCSTRGEQVACGTVHSRLDQRVVCGEGIMSCDGSTWGECIINNAVTLKSIARPSIRPLALGGVSACEANPCDPGCRSFDDTPDDLELSADAGVIATSDGVTLPGGGSVIVPGIGGSGFNCSNAAYPEDSGCAHHICRIGSALDQWCDGAAPTTAPLTIFSDGFDGGNTQGWILGTNWEVDDAVSSTGHSSGSADPSSDTTSTSDDNVAGTVLGGNIGGTVTVFSEAFGNLGNWTESDETDWTKTWSSEGAIASNCDTQCTLSLTNGIDLSSYSSATLSFRWRLNSAVDTGEYLKAMVFDGSTWTEITTKAGNVDPEGSWQTFSFNLASYLVSGFKVSFVAKSSESSEYIEVDDVTVTGQQASTTSYLLSPVINTATSASTVTLTFKRWLNLNADFIGKVELYNGSTWTALYTSSGAVADSSWQSMSYDITAYKSANTQVRFSYTGASTNGVSGWNIDDVSVIGTQDIPGSSLCVSKICAARPECCTDSWSLDCVGLLDDVCQVDCAIDADNGNACVACFNDPTMTVDVDGDGQSPATGDCRECDPAISAGAYDLPGNSIDEDCDGTADNEVVSCDSTLAADSTSPVDFAKAMGLCKTAGTNTWGLVSATFVRANGSTECTNALQRRIMSTFGSGNSPTEGSKMSAFSSGTARASSETGYVKPYDDGYIASTSSSPLYSIPAASGCSAGTAGKDSCGLKLVIRAPTNANSFGYNFNFFTSEYPEYICTSYNDAYVAYYEGSLNTQANKNISFDSAGNPVSVNNGLFTVPGGWPPQAGGTHPKLDGTGYDGVCVNSSYVGVVYNNNSICGGSTDWLQTTAPVAPGEEITLVFNIWDTGDNKWDSTVLLDNFTWSTETAKIETGVYTPGTSDTEVPATYNDGWFTRDYDMTGVCADGLAPLWSLWSWDATTPSDSRIEFFVQTAETAAGLATAPRDPLIFTDPPGPTAFAGAPAVAEASSPDTQSGLAVVYEAMEAQSRVLHYNHLRISAHLVPSSDLIQAPVLKSWNLQSSCTALQ